MTRTPGMNPENSAFDVVRALSLAQASAAAYLDRASQRAQGYGEAEVHPFVRGAVSGFLTEHQGELVIAFRGTLLPEEGRVRAVLAQWLTHMNYAQTSTPTGRVHEGMWTSLDRAWDRVSSAVREQLRGGQRLWLTGHSVGGALATLAAERLLDEGVEVAGVYTFGAPRVGDPHYATSYRPVLHRVENSNDLIPHLPLSPRVLATVAPLLERVTGPLLGLNLPSDVVYQALGRLTYMGGDELQADLSSERAESLDIVRHMRLGYAVFTGGAASLVEDHAVGRYVEQLAGLVD